MLIVFSLISSSQITITADGKNVTTADCSMSDVKIIMPLPSNYKGYDLVNVNLRLFVPEHGPGTQLGAGCYYSEKSNTFYEGKSTIDLIVKSADENSDFKEGEFRYYALNYLDLEEICSDPMRKFTYVNVSIEVIPM